MATAQPRGLPPYVEPCVPGSMVSMIFLEPRTQETGYMPPEMALPRRTRSGLMLLHSWQSIFPVRAMPVWISSQMRRTLCLSQRARTSLR